METQSIVKTYYRGYEVTLAALVSRILVDRQAVLTVASWQVARYPPQKKTSRKVDLDL